MSQRTMQAIAQDKFGGVDTLKLQTIPVPEPGTDEVLIRIEAAGVGEWDPFEREGGYAEMQGGEPHFPYVLGSEGAGKIEAISKQVDDLQVGDRVYASGFLNPKGGFYAEYAVAKIGYTRPIPDGLTVEQAASMAGVGITALRGLEDILRLQSGESILILGASGGIGHIAVQLAKRMGARVFAVASGAEGVSLVERLGADRAINGYEDDITTAAQKFAPNGFDCALLTAGGEAAEKAIQTVRAGGRIVYPNGINPEPAAREDVQFTSYNGEPDADIIQRFHQMISDGTFKVHVARTFPLENAAEAHQALDSHYLGKLALKVNDE